MLIDLPSHNTDIKPVKTTKDLTTHIQNRKKDQTGMQRLNHVSQYCPVSVLLQSQD